MTSNSSDSAIPRSGYDLPIYGLADGTFYTLHIIAISSLSISVICVVITIVVSCSTNNHHHFYTSWHKRGRFVIYMAVCDGMMAVCHLADHVDVVISMEHVYPKGLCVFYAFVVVVMMIAHNLLVNAIAINAFALMYIDRNLDFGRWDWKLHSWVFGVPLICAIVSTALDRYGPTGFVCSFDGIRGGSYQLAMVTIPIIVILSTNAILYVLIWARLHAQTSAIRRNVGRMSAGMRATHKAARSMILFVAAYILQWWVFVLYGFLTVFSPPPPQTVVKLLVTFVNLGGFFNLVVFIIIRRSSARAGGGVSNNVGNRPHEASVQNPVFSVPVDDVLPMD